MTDTLRSTINSPEVEQDILWAAAQRLGRTRRLEADYEHGQWWITDLDSGRQWSVVDAEGGPAVDGFDFELVSDGDED